MRNSFSIDGLAAAFELRRNLREVEWKVKSECQGHPALNVLQKKEDMIRILSEVQEKLRSAQYLIGHEVAEAIIYEDNVNVEEEFDLELRMRGER